MRIRIRIQQLNLMQILIRNPEKTSMEAQLRQDGSGWGGGEGGGEQCVVMSTIPKWKHKRSNIGS
jgi:hypothetical protein